MECGDGVRVDHAQGTHHLSVRHDVRGAPGEVRGVCTLSDVVTIRAGLVLGYVKES